MFDMAGYRRGQKIRSGDVYRLLVFARTCASGLGSAFRCCARSSGASHPSPEAAFRCSETCRPDGVRRQWEERSRSVLFEECDSEFMAFGQNLDVEEHTRTCFDLSIGWSFPRTALFSCALSPPCRRDEPCPARNLFCEGHLNTRLSEMQISGHLPGSVSSPLGYQRRATRSRILDWTCPAMISKEIATAAACLLRSERSFRRMAPTRQ